MSRNGLYAIIAVLVIAIIAFAIYAYQQENQPGLEVRVDDSGISVEGNS